MVCPEEEVTFDEITSITGGLTDTEVGGSVAYQWEVNFNGVGFEEIEGATQEFYTTTEIAPGEYIYRRKVTDHCDTVAYTNEITILRDTLEVLEGGTIIYDGDPTVCPVQVVYFNNVTPATGGLTNTEMGGSVSYQWQVSTDNGVTFADIVDTTEAFYTTTQTAAGTYFYRRMVTDECGTTAYTNEISFTRLIGGPLVGGVITYTAPSILCGP